MKAFVLAGGFGTRLRPLTIHLPKPMVPMGNVPMMQHVVNQLIKHDFTEIVFMLHYQPESITSHFGDGGAFKAHFTYVKPDADLGTAGCLRPGTQSLVKKEPQEPSLVISGDVLTDIDLGAAWEFHKKKKALVTIVLTRSHNPLQYGVVITNADGRIQRFLEKPSWGEVFSDTINTGIYILEPEVVNHIPEGEPFDFSKNLFPQLLAAGQPLYGYVAKGYWKDVGDLTEYRTAHLDLLDGKIDLTVPGKPLKNHPNVRAGTGTVIEDGVRFQGSVLLGANCRIGKGADIRRSVLGNNVRVGDSASIRNSVVWDHSVLDTETALREAIIARGVSIGKRARIEVGCVVADGCTVGADARLKPWVKMWPQKALEEGATLSTSLVWGERWAKALFGAYGVVGLTNIEITPEFAAKMGAAYGAFLGPGAYVITSRDAHKASRMIKRSFISGLLSTGVRVGDLRTAPAPVVRYELGKEGEQGGVHVRQSPFDARLTDILLFEKDGSDLSLSKERAIEQLFMREDFRRAPPEEVGELTVPPRAQEYYRTGFLKSIDVESIRRAAIKIVIDYSHSDASTIFPHILGQLGVQVVALNAHLAVGRITRSQTEFQESMDQLSHIVTTLGAQVGFLMDNGGEKLFLVDERGRIIPQEVALAIVGDMVLRAKEAKRIAYPVQSSSLLESIAQMAGVSVIRTPTAARHIVRAAMEPEVGFVGDGVGGFIFPKFQPAFDAMYGLAKILELMARTDSTLASTWDSIPQRARLGHRKVPCAWDKKGLVMRLAQEEGDGRKLELIDGVKIHFEDGWALILPDANEAYCHIWAEAETQKKVDGYLKEFGEKIKLWQEKAERVAVTAPAGR